MNRHQADRIRHLYERSISHCKLCTIVQLRLARGKLRGFRPGREVFASQCPVDAEACLGSLRCRDNRKLDVLDDVAGHEYAGHAGRFVLSASDPAVSSELTAERFSQARLRTGRRVEEKGLSQQDPAPSELYRCSCTPAPFSREMRSSTSSIPFRCNSNFASESKREGPSVHKAISRVHAVIALAISNPRAPLP